MKERADHNLNVAQVNEFTCNSLENIVGKGENAGNQHFLLFLLCFQNTSFPGSLKLRTLWKRINPLPNDKISEGTKLKAFADNKLNVTKMMISLYDRVENTVGKGENAGYQHFLLYPQCFPKPSSLGSLKVRIV